MVSVPFESMDTKSKFELIKTRLSCRHNRLDLVLFHLTLHQVYIWYQRGKTIHKRIKPAFLNRNDCSFEISRA